MSGSRRDHFNHFVRRRWHIDDSSGLGRCYPLEAAVTGCHNNLVPRYPLRDWNWIKSFFGKSLRLFTIQIRFFYPSDSQQSSGFSLMRLPRSVRAERTTTKAMIVEEVSFSYIIHTDKWIRSSSPYIDLLCLFQFLIKQIRPRFPWVYRRDNPLGMLGKHEKSL